MYGHGCFEGWAGLHPLKIGEDVGVGAVVEVFAQHGNVVEYGGDRNICGGQGFANQVGFLGQYAVELAKEEGGFCGLDLEQSFAEG
jgi:hypothetical protein